LVSANSLNITSGGQIATTAEGGNGGDVNLAVAGDILLDGAGPLIAAESSGQGDAGSIMLSASTLRLKDGASISTQAATANGGNIALTVGAFVYLVDSTITTSVKGSAGNGGNITIDPRLVVLDSSDIIAQAVAGHGGNIFINASNLIASTDSLVSASSQLGISGTVELIGPRVDLNGSLVVLPSDLRAAAEVARTSCDARARKESSLVNSGYGGLPQDTESAIPALYILNRDLRLDLPPAVGRKAGNNGWLPPLPATAHLTMGCG
jgi:large exoprotein involved in heme utilization and adhesion